MRIYLFISSVIVVWVLSLSALPASAGEPVVYCIDKQTVQQFTKETSGLTSTLKAKGLELRDENLYTISEASRLSSPDYGKINRLESEINELKSKINAAAKKYGIPVYRCQS